MSFTGDVEDSINLRVRITGVIPVFILVYLVSPRGYTQTLGGENVFSFLKFPNTPQLTGLGGLNISNESKDVGMSFQNPALLKPDMHGQLNVVYNAFFAGVKNFHAQFAYFKKEWETTIGFGVQYFHYGAITETDASGNIYGEIQPADYVLQLNALHLMQQYCIQILRNYCRLHWY